MINAKEELLNHIEDREVEYVYITIGDPLYSKICKGTLEEVLPKLENVVYDSGFGIQELFGTIWYTDGTWSERGEYDGSEWWEHRERPKIPM